MKKIAEILKNKKWVTLICLGILLILWLANKPAKTATYKGKALAAVKADPNLSAKVAEVKSQSFKEVISAQGKVTGTEIELRFETAGKLESFDLKPGKRVEKGEILAQLNGEEASLKIQYRRTKLEALKAQFDSAQTKLTLYEDLFETGYLIPAKLEEIRLEKETKEKEYRSAHLELLSAEKEFEKVSLKAPANGVVAKVESANGEFVPLGTKIATMVDQDDLFLELTITESHAHKIHPGQQVALTTHPLKNKKFLGTVEGVVPLIDGKSRTFITKVKLSEGSEGLIPGMFVRAQITLYEQADTLTVPITALIKEENKVYVAVLDAEKRVEFRLVELGYLKEEVAEIKQGLKEGDVVVVDSSRPVQRGEVLHVVSES